jgi:hypothetical protein
MSTTNTARIELAIDRLAKGMTAVVFGHVVTKWDSEVIEVDTWGKKTVGVVEAAARIAE